MAAFLKGIECGVDGGDHVKLDPIIREITTQNLPTNNEYHE